MTAYDKKDTDDLACMQRLFTADMNMVSINAAGHISLIASYHQSV